MGTIGMKQETMQAVSKAALMISKAFFEEGAYPHMRVNKDCNEFWHTECDGLNLRPKVSQFSLCEVCGEMLYWDKK